MLEIYCFINLHLSPLANRSNRLSLSKITIIHTNYLCHSICSDSSITFGNPELFADQLLEITTQVLRADDCGEGIIPLLAPHNFPIP